MKQKNWNVFFAQSTKTSKLSFGNRSTYAYLKLGLGLRNVKLPRMCGRGASAPAQKRPTRTAHTARRRRPVAMVLVAPAVCALGRGLLRAQHHPRLHMRVRSAAIQRGAQAGAAGACVSAAPDGAPRGRQLFNMRPMWPVGAPHC